MNVNWKGVFPALTTKFTSNDELDLPLFEKNLQAQLKAGVDGIILGGSLGEASVLTEDEKQKLVQFAVEKTAGKVPVVLNIAEGATREAVQQTLYAKAWGAKGRKVSHHILGPMLLLQYQGPRQGRETCLPQMSLAMTRSLRSGRRRVCGREHRKCRDRESQQEPERL